MENISQRIIEQIIDDLKGRRGLRQAWESIDEDIQEEIKDDWRDIVKDELEVK